MKEQFKDAVSDQFEDIELDDEEESDVEVNPPVRNTSDVRLRSTADRTNQKYECRIKYCEHCSASEDTEILYILEPEYDIVIGYDHSLPLELCWTECDWHAVSAEDIDDDWTDDDPLVGSEVALIECESCGEENAVRFASDGGLLVAASQHPTFEVTIAKDRLPYRSEPKDDWRTENVE